MRFLKSKLFIIAVSSVVVFNALAFFCVFYSVPQSISITKDKVNGEWLPKNISWLANTKVYNVSPAMENTAKNINKSKNSFKAEVCLYGILPVKTVDVSVNDEIYVVPGGESIGINLKTKGVLVVGIAKFISAGKKISPAGDSGIRTGDIICEINGKKIEKIKDVKSIVNESREYTLSGYRNSEKKNWLVTAQCCDDTKKPRLGLWVRESVAGIGTVSFYTDTHFAALGHPISDIDTGRSVVPHGGTICSAKIIGVDKGEKGTPGSLKGVFSGKEYGKITANSYCGVFGTINSPPQTKKLPLGSSSDVKPGDATIRCDVGKGTKSYSVNIVGITRDGALNKSMVIKITDSELLEKTGGIVQGMSGSPIIQNGRIVGAVTHVFVNDPTRGYGIFIENMLAEAEKIK